MERKSSRGKAEKRRKAIKECPNPLFLKWLERWRDEAKAKDSKLQYVYNKAIGSLKKYPLPLESGKEATILDGIGASIAKRLDEELEKHNTNLQKNVVLNVAADDIAETFPDLRVPSPPDMVVTSPVVNGTPKSSEEPKTKKKRKSSPREYVPLYRSGPYAMMIALLKARERIGYKGYLTKHELQQQAQPYSETSFTIPEPDSYYTAWSSMSTLIKKSLVMKSGNPARFSLTDAGFSLANKLTMATATHNSTISSPSRTLPELPTPSFSPPTTSVLPKPRTPSTPRARGVSKPRTPTASPQIISSPTSTSVNNPPATESVSPFPRYGNPSKDFLASYRYKTSGTTVPQCQLGCLKFWYIGNDGECVDHQDKAAVIIDDEISFGYLVKCRQSEMDQATVKYKLDASRPSKDGYVFVYIASESITLLSEATGSHAAATEKKSTVAPVRISNVSDDDSDDEMLMRPLFERLGGCKNDSEKKTKSENTLKQRNINTLSEISLEIETITECSQAKVLASSKSAAPISNLTPPSLSIPEKRSLHETYPPQKEQTAHATKPGIQENEPNHTMQPTKTKQTIDARLASNQTKQPTTMLASRLITAENISPQRESVTSSKVDKVIKPEYELKAGSYEIVLCVDFIETTGGSKTGRKEEMVKELRMNGVYFDVRKLNVGDFLWIAREKMLPVPGQLVLPERRELVLDYIVERKRMDDLCSSIKDGRFKEQKFRLLNSGLRHPVYLVEDFGSMNFMSMPAQTLEQAIANTQIGQEFFVKRTRDIKESAAYLTLMTRYLETAYENQTLKAITKDDMEHVKVQENQVNTFLMTFQELNDISIKNRVLTVGELFGKQLLQIPGVAAEKVIGILEHYSTLRDLLDAYEEQTTEKEKENLLSDIKFGKTQRKIGPSVSRTVYQLYCTKGALS